MEFFPDRNIVGVDTPVMILRDSAYGKETYLMKPKTIIHTITSIAEIVWWWRIPSDYFKTD